MPEFKKVAMVSSTVLDLPDHRREVREACLRQDIFPLMMESLPASDADAVSVSLGMVDRADIYIGVFAYRYGHVPAGREISITEMEYNRACERGIPRLIFVIDRDHLIKRQDVECGDGAEKLRTLLERIDRVWAKFLSPADLRAHVIDSLARLRVSDLDALLREASK
jgi:Domain of unknown function (DUF4062)